MKRPGWGRWLWLLSLLPATAALCQPGAGSDAVCDSARQHTVAEGELLGDLAAAYFDDRRRWTAIYSVNAATLAATGQPATGMQLRIPCLDLDARSGGRPTVNADAGLKLLTAGARPPLVDRESIGGGLITEIVAESLSRAPAAERFSLTWIDQRERHLGLLSGKRYDLGFPWTDPGCSGDSAIDMCRNFHFSIPLFDALVLLFVRRDAPIGYRGDESLAGLRLCRPADADTSGLDRPGRQSLQGQGLELVRADSVADCFTLLQRQQVDAVAVDEFTGRLVLMDLDYGDSIDTEPVPLRVRPLHAIVSRTHRRGTTILYRLNAGLHRFRAAGEFDRIVDRHLSAYWRRVGAPPVDPAATEAHGTLPSGAPQPAGEPAQSNGGASLESAPGQ